MALGQVLLDTMETLNQELQLQTGEVDVTRAILALNRAQDYFEALVAQEEDLMGDTVGTIATSANTETTAFPTGVLRLDRLTFIDPSTSKPAYDLTPTRKVGTSPRRWLYDYVAVPSSQTGKPTAYWTDGRLVYWVPLPNGTHTIRWWGFSVASDISAVGTFAYPDICILPFASFATAIMAIGVGDNPGDLVGLAESNFRPVIDTLSNFNRDGARPLHYSQSHDT